LKNPLNHHTKYRLGLFALTLLGIAAATAAGPAEKSLGVNVRVVYLHGVWVWTALAGFLAAGATGLIGLLARREGLQRWSRALGRTGLIFWITYLPVSVWAMQTNWNGLYLSEPRWRLALIFAITGILLQTGLALLEDPAWASAGNLGFLIALIAGLRATQNVMHPPSPILDSESRLIQIFFFVLLAFVLFAGWQVAGWLHRLEVRSRSSIAPR
jgi:hypothetical protein